MTRRQSEPRDDGDRLGSDEPRGHRPLDDDDLEILDRQLFSEDSETVDRRRDPLRR